MSEDAQTGAQKSSAAQDTYIAGVKDYFQLLKPRVMTLVVFTGLAGLVVAPGSISPFLALVAIACIAISAGAAGAINMWYDRDIDAVMKRTINRPIPAGKIAAPEALTLGIFLTAMSFALMGLATNWVAGFLLLGANLFYVLIYTMWLKRSTPQNIVIGGAAGAFPPMIGWAAVTGDVTWTSLALFMITFLWTPPHFWALALYHEGDYGAAKIPMLPNVAGERHTKMQMIIYCILLIPVSVIPTLLGHSSWIYGAIALILGFVFLSFSLRVWRAESGDHGPAKAMFRFSLLYLTLIFAALMLDQLITYLLAL